MVSGMFAVLGEPLGGEITKSLGTLHQHGVVCKLKLAVLELNT